jgi:hypothetical protein
MINTPFRIHNENDIASSRTVQKSTAKGLRAAPSTDVIKPGLGTSAKTPGRKALGALTNSQVNVLASSDVNTFKSSNKPKTTTFKTPGLEGPRNQKFFIPTDAEISTKKPSKKVSIVEKAEPTAPVNHVSKKRIDPKSMVCSKVTQRKDPYDYVMEEASKIKVIINPLSPMDYEPYEGPETLKKKAKELAQETAASLVASPGSFNLWPEPDFMNAELPLSMSDADMADLFAIDANVVFDSELSASSMISPLAAAAAPSPVADTAKENTLHEKMTLKLPTPKSDKSSTKDIRRPSISTGKKAPLSSSEQAQPRRSLSAKASGSAKAEDQNPIFHSRAHYAVPDLPEL